MLMPYNRIKGKMGKKKDICQPNNAAVIINKINTSKEVVRPKLAHTTMLLPYNRRLLQLVEAGLGIGMGQDERWPRWKKNKVIHPPNNTAVIINIIKTAKEVV